MFQTRFTRAFRVRLPIMGAPMAGVSGGLLAAATTKAGGLGFIAAGHLESFDALREQVGIFRKEAPESPLAIGFLSFSSMQNGFRRIEAVLEEHKPSFVQYYAPAVMGDNIKLAQSFGAIVVAQVGCEKHAVEAMSAGADCLVVQGKEAGGHGLRAPYGSSTLPLAARVARIVEESEKDVSVLAAGGIVDGRGLVAALSLGCDGAVFGTRLWASKEALGHNSFKEALVRAGPDDVTRSIVFDQIQNTYRTFPWPKPFDSSGALRNEITKKWFDDPNGLTELLLSEGKHSLIGDHREAEKVGNASKACVFAGEGVGEIKAIESVEEIMKRTEMEAMSQIKKLMTILQT